MGISPSVFKIRRAYQTYMKTIARLLGGGSNSKQKMMNIYNFEAGLAGVGYSRSCNVITSKAHLRKNNLSEKVDLSFKTFVYQIL